MTRLEKRLAAFKECTGTFPWADFEGMLKSMGYEEVKKGKIGGSRRKYMHAITKHLIFLHEPHGTDLGKGTVEKLQEKLTEQGML